MFIIQRKIFFAILVLNLRMSTEAYRIFTVLYNVPIAKI